MKNYSEMSDFEINCEVAWNFFDSDWLDKHKGIDGMVTDYCNDPAEAWPIIVENKISVIATKNGWLCVPNDSVVDGWTGD